MALTHSSAGKLEGAIPLTEETGDTSDISEDLDFRFYEEIRFKDNAGFSHFEPGCWLGLSNHTGGLICCHVLTQRVTVISHSIFLIFTNIKKTPAEVKYMFQKFNEATQKKMKICSGNGYIRDKPSPNHWEHLIENNSYFRKEFEIIYNNDKTLESDDEDYTPDVLDDTYLNMELDLPRDSKGP